VDLIVDTDCGHDPDDFFTLCYLAAAGVKLRCVTVTPGDRDQLAIVRFFCDQVGLDIPVGASSKAGGQHIDGLEQPPSCVRRRLGDLPPHADRCEIQNTLLACWLHVGSVFSTGNEETRRFPFKSPFVRSPLPLGGWSLLAYSVPQVVQMNFGIAHHPLGNPHTPGVTSSTEFPAGSRK
jgi:hypothetical protein